MNVDVIVDGLKVFHSDTILVHNNHTVNFRFSDTELTMSIRFEDNKESASSAASHIEGNEMVVTFHNVKKANQRVGIFEPVELGTLDDSPLYFSCLLQNLPEGTKVLTYLDMR